MLKILFLVFISAIMFNTIAAQNNMEKFNPEKLSATGQIAYMKLLKFTEFEEPVFKEDEKVSEGIESFNILFDDKFADEAFKSLLNEATLAGQLYALCGIYYTDSDFFKEVIEKYKLMDALVLRKVPTMKFMFKITTLIESQDPNVAIIPPGETLKDFWGRHKGGYQIDIIHGGYPATFRHYKDFNKDKS